MLARHKIPTWLRKSGCSRNESQLSEISESNQNTRTPVTRLGRPKIYDLSQCGMEVR